MAIRGVIIRKNKITIDKILYDTADTIARICVGIMQTVEDEINE